MYLAALRLTGSSCVLTVRHVCIVGAQALHNVVCMQQLFCCIVWLATQATVHRLALRPWYTDSGMTQLGVVCMGVLAMACCRFFASNALHSLAVAAPDCISKLLVLATHHAGIAQCYIAYPLRHARRCK